MPAPPPGFVLDQNQDQPSLPEGFVLDEPEQQPARLPWGKIATNPGMWGQMLLTNRPGREAVKEDLSARLPVIGEQLRHGQTWAMSDEIDAMDAMREDQFGWLGKAGNTLMDYHPMSFAHDMANGITGVMMGNQLRENEAYDTALTASRENIAENREDFPLTSFAAEMAGGAYAPGAPVRSAATGVTASRPILETGVRSALTGLGYGTAYGIGEGEEGSRLQTGAQGGAFGLGLGGLLGAGGAKVGQWLNGTQQGRMLSDAIDLAREPSKIGNAARNDFLTLLERSGVPRERVGPLLMAVNQRIEGRSSPTLFARALIEELEATNPQAAQQIGRAWRQLFLAPASEGDTGVQLSRAVDDQARSQEGTLNKALDEVLGTQTIADDLDMLARERELIGGQRDAIYANIGGVDEASGVWRANMGQNSRLPQRTARWADEYSNDSEVQGFMRAAARDLGFRGNTEAADAIARDPVAFLNKFQEVTGAKSRTAAGVSPVAEQARQEALTMLDDASRFVRRGDGDHSFAPRVEGEQGPLRRKQLEFKQNYSAEEAIEEARGQLTKLRDPLQADTFVRWFEGLPSGEQELVKTVLRNDLSKIMQGGKMTDDSPWLTHINKRSVADGLRRVLGEEDGGRLIDAFTDVLEEQRIVGGMLDPRHANGQPRTALGRREAQDARHLYTRSPLRHFDDIPTFGLFFDTMNVASGMPPWLTAAKGLGKLSRPRSGTREQLADLLSMRVGGGNRPARPSGNALANAAPPANTAPVANALTPDSGSPAPARLAPPVEPAQAPQPINRPTHGRVAEAVARQEQSPASAPVRPAPETPQQPAPQPRTPPTRAEREMRVLEGQKRAQEASIARATEAHQTQRAKAQEAFDAADELETAGYTDRAAEIRAEALEMKNAADISHANTMLDAGLSYEDIHRATGLTFVDMPTGQGAARIGNIRLDEGQKSYAESADFVRRWLDNAMGENATAADIQNAAPALTQLFRAAGSENPASDIQMLLQRAESREAAKQAATAVAKQAAARQAQIRKAVQTVMGTGAIAAIGAAGFGLYEASKTINDNREPASPPERPPTETMREKQAVLVELGYLREARSYANQDFGRAIEKFRVDQGLQNLKQAHEALEQLARDRQPPGIPPPPSAKPQTGNALAQ